MTNFAKFINSIEENFAIEILIERGDMNPYYGSIEINEAGETVAILDFEEDPYGEGDEYDESFIRANFVSSAISNDLLSFLDESPVTEGVVKEWKEELKRKFMLKGWHVK